MGREVCGGEVTSSDPLSPPGIAVIVAWSESTRSRRRPTAYSAALNPIALAFSKLKALLRKAAERTVGALWDRIGQVLEAFTPQECANYFRQMAMPQLVRRML